MPDVADRHLLFGLIALQVGLVDQAELVAAFQAWARDKARPLAEHLADRGRLEPDGLAAVDAMVALHLKRHGGDPEKSLAAIPAARSTREGLAALSDPKVNETIAHVMSRPERVDDDVDGDDDPDDERTATRSVGSATSAGQRFHILRPHAKGGLGAVYVALDTELRREVALKQILGRHADDPDSRARFILEAEVTGGLEHPGIVPVYGLGYFPNGRPYYAMRLIKGDSLKEAVDRFHADLALKDDPGRRSLELRNLLHRFVDVCNAVAYAHSRGVLHRDLKPANVVIGRYGETLVVDWGLAKPMGRAEPLGDVTERTLRPAAASGSSDTLPGRALGTPAYMSPEQAAGQLDRLGPHSDVYSLGATLYYLLAGKAPFSGEPAEVLRAVQQGTFEPPRRLDPTIEKAMEAVCLKAMAHRPEDRYATPRALADDLERWMADEPVSAWREPIARRARRWAKRNRTAVTAAVTAAAGMLIAGVIGLAAVLAVETRAKAAIARALEGETRANRRLAASNDELDRSRAAVQERYDLAVAAIRTFHTGVSEDFLLKQDQFKELRDRLLKAASDFYGKLGALLGKETDPASRRALARANFELAELTAKVGRHVDALAAHRAVLAARRTAAGEPDAGDEARADVGRSLTAVAGLLAATGKTDEALAAYREAEGLLVGPASSSTEARAALADCRSRLGGLLSAIGRNQEALAAYRLARADQEASAAIAGAADEARRDLAATINRIGVLLAQTGRPADAEAEFRRALAIRLELLAQYPDVTELRSGLAGSHTNLGILLSQTGRPREAEAEDRKALAIQKALADSHPAVTEFRSSLALAYNNLGGLLRETGRPGEAVAEGRKALAIYQKLADDQPAVTQYRSRLAAGHSNLGLLLSEMGRPSEAEPEFREALAIHQKLDDEHPAVTEFRGSLADSHTNLGLLLTHTGKLLEAEAEDRKAVALYQDLADEHPAVTEFRGSLADGHTNLGLLLTQAGRLTEAEAELRAAVAVRRVLADRYPAVIRFRHDLALGSNNLGDWYSTKGKAAEAEAAFRAATEIYQELADGNPTVAGFRGRLAGAQGRLGRRLLQSGRTAEALDVFAAGEENGQALADARAASPDEQDDLATSRTNLATALLRLGRTAEARARCEQAAAMHEDLVRDHPTVEGYRRDLAEALLRSGQVRRAEGNFAGASADWRRAGEIYRSFPDRRGGYHLLLEASCRAAMAGLAGAAGSGVPADEGPAEADRAMDRLRQAIAMGYRDRDAVRTEPALDPLRGREDFRLLMLDLAFPIEPFAPGG